MMFTNKPAGPKGKAKPRTWRNPLSFGNLALLAMRLGLKRPKPAPVAKAPAPIHPWARGLVINPPSADKATVGAQAKPPVHTKATPAPAATGPSVAQAVASAIAADRLRCEAIIASGIETGLVTVAASLAFRSELTPEAARESLQAISQDRANGQTLAARMHRAAAAQQTAQVAPAPARTAQEVAAMVVAAAEKAGPPAHGRAAISPDRMRLVHIRPAAGTPPAQPTA